MPSSIFAISATGGRWPRRRLTQAGAILLAAGSLIVASTATAVAAVTDNLELDGNVVDDSGGPPDWQNLFTTGTLSTAPTAAASLPSGFVGANFFRDFIPNSTADNSTYATGSKDTLDITPGWQCKKSNNVTDKGDIQNTYMTPYRDPVSGHLIIYAGLEKNAPNGDNNMAVWLLKDGTVGCTAGSGNTPFTGHHQNDDTLLVAAFLNGGGNPVINAYQWENGALNGPLATGHACGRPDSANLCAITNAGNITTPWFTDDKTLGTGHTLQGDQFYEMGADLTALNINDCFANYLADTRSSQELGATLYDFAGGSAPTCGSLSVNKYIDVDKSGTSNTGDITSGTVVAGWSFTVKGPSPSTTTVCSGTTDTTGALVCSTGSLTNLTPGTYTVTETQKTGFFNTDPGDGAGGTFNTGSTASKTVSVTFSGASVSLGNTCFVDKTFRITGVPDGTADLVANWTKTSGDGTSSSGSVTLTDAGNTTLHDGIYQGTLNDTLAQNAHISWGWNYATNPVATDVSGASDENLSSGGYPTCAKLNTASFPSTELDGVKYKDVDHSGTQNTGDLAGAGFTFQLKQGSTVLQTATSDSSGNFKFTQVNPGTYTVHEVVPTGWQQTEPVNGSGAAIDRTVTVSLGDTSLSIGAWGDTPLSDIGATFSAEAKNPGTTTDSTKSTITCKDGSNNTVASGTGGSVSATGLYIGTYTCTIVITDP